MNPITNAKNLNKINLRELEMGAAGSSASWHSKYKDSAWVFVGGLPYDLTEGDVICIFSQYGEINNINLVRDKKTGNFKGFGFLCYEDQRSTILAVDNFNGTKILNRTIRVDHVENYRVPKLTGEEDERTKELYLEGVAPKPVVFKSDSDSGSDRGRKKKRKKERKLKKEKKDKDRKRKREDSTAGKKKKRRKHSDDDLLPIPNFVSLPAPQIKKEEEFDPRTMPIALEPKINPFDHDIRKDPFEKKFANPLYSSFLRKDDAYLPGRLNKR